MEYFSKKYRHLKSKILHKFHRLLFVFFYFFSILLIFISYFTYPNLAKNSKHFCGALLYGLQILSENSGKFFNFYQKRQRYFKYKIFLEFHRLLFTFFNFLVFLTSFFFYFTCLQLSKNCKIFVLFYCMDPRFYQNIGIFEIQNFNKIPQFTMSFLFFQNFWHFVFYFTYPTLSKNYGIFCSVLLEGLEILPTISGKF